MWYSKVTCDCHVSNAWPMVTLKFPGGFMMTVWVDEQSANELNSEAGVALANEIRRHDET